MEMKTRAALEAEVVELKGYVEALEAKLEVIADVVGEAEDDEDDECDEKEFDDEEEADEFEDEEDTDDTEACPSRGRQAA